MEMHAAFPEKLENLIVVFVSSETVIYVSPKIARHVAQNEAAVKETIKSAGDYMRSHKKIALANGGINLAGIKVKRIAIDEDASYGALSGWLTEEVRRIATFDHETGHLVVESGLSSPSVTQHLAECAADAYAVLRHVQRFGLETNFFENFVRAEHVVLDTSPINYTDDVVQGIRHFIQGGFN